MATTENLEYENVFRNRKKNETPSEQTFETSDLEGKNPKPTKTSQQRKPKEKREGRPPRGRATQGRSIPKANK